MHNDQTYLQPDDISFSPLYFLIKYCTDQNFFCFNKYRYCTQTASSNEYIKILGNALACFWQLDEKKCLVCAVNMKL